MRFLQGPMQLYGLLTIAIQQCGVAAIQLDAFLVCDEDWDLGPILAGHKRLHTAHNTPQPSPGRPHS
jgi:hypothetical protein